jgi:hypothetical protein
MSNPRIAAQAVPGLLVAFPGWKQPTLVNVRATIGGGAGVATTQTTEGAQGEPPTTLGWSLVRSAAGIYDLLFPAVRRWAPSTLHSMTKTVATNGTFAVTDARQAVIDRSATNTVPRGIPATPATGRIRLGFFTNAGAVPAELADGLEVNISLWVDLG